MSARPGQIAMFEFDHAGEAAEAAAIGMRMRADLERLVMSRIGAALIEFHRAHGVIPDVTWAGDEAGKVFTLNFGFMVTP